jgi:hypothetical protein
MASPPNAGAAVFLQTGGDSVLLPAGKALEITVVNKRAPSSSGFAASLRASLIFAKWRTKPPIHNPGGN